jgi:DNA-binding NarL/FixJ family response regulator
LPITSAPINHPSVEQPFGRASGADVVVLLAAIGQTTRHIAKSLHLSEQTFHNYRSDFMEKLGLRDRAETLKDAIRRGILNVADL